MTGRLAVDEFSPIGSLEYSSERDDPAWDRFTIRFADGGTLRMNDPRRFGSIEIDPDLGRLGPDATEISVAELHAAMASDRSIKAVLLDQSRIAGLGNLLVDETLWRAGLDPARSARSLDLDTVGHLRRVMRRTVSLLSRRGGSHLGDLQDERHQGGVCPRDGAELLRRTVAGRTTLSCPLHQR
jgi:formamidopyrimidine-DNA glycosylase